MLDTLKTLCDLRGVSGVEDDVRDYIRARVAARVQDVRTDALGNLIVRVKGRRQPQKTVLLTAHMDEVGLIVTDITDDGYVKFGSVGGIDRRVLIGKTVWLGKGACPGAVGSRAVHLIGKDERDAVAPLEDMYIDIGAGSRQEAEKLVRLGDAIAFDSAFAEFGDGFVKGKALDDRVGCAALIRLIEEVPAVDCTAVFAVQEEVGNRGAFGAAFSVAPDVALVLETTTAADLPSVSGAKKVCRVGGGAVVPFMDRGAIYDRRLCALITETADRHGIPWQTKTQIAGGTDASALQRSRGGVAVAAISVPVRYLHGPASVAALSDIEAVYNLSARALEAIGEEY